MLNKRMGGFSPSVARVTTVTTAVSSMEYGKQEICFFYDLHAGKESTA